MPTLPLIADPARYRACIQNLLTDGEVVRTYWLDLFVAHVETLAKLPVNDQCLRDSMAWSAFRDDYLAGLADLRRTPDLRGRLTVLELTRYRDEKLHAHGFVDPFLDLKIRENTLALRLLPTVLAALDAAPPDTLGDSLARGLFAGNLFDMGSKAVVSEFESGTFDFLTARDRVRPRPWPVDDLDHWLLRLNSRQLRYRQCLFFVDNAGPDILLGVIPFVRDLLFRETRVILAANSAPALNDITAAELRPLLERVRTVDSRIDAALRDERLTVIESGCASPLIDLTELTHECCDAAEACDLLILEGMGRAIESNYDARFTRDTLKIALIKDRMVADILGVRLFDPIWRFEQADPRE
ncbi:MAG: ARMT1-like domain-containing protein [Planctomycetota bacterium]